MTISEGVIQTGYRRYAPWIPSSSDEQEGERNGYSIAFESAPKV